MTPVKTPLLKLSFLCLLLTAPFLNSTTYWGIPLWAWGSLVLSVMYALILFMALEKEWDE